MSVNLSKNRESLITAWKDVLNDKTDTNWAIFGYEGQSNDLKVVDKGSGGIEEMSEELNSGKIMYAFVKINDPKTSLDKCVLINWQGEGANTVRKGLCANHLRDIENFFSGAQLTLNARNEDEVEPQLIIDKVAKAGSSVYNFKAPRSEHIEPSGPVGTTYKRINPVQDINSKERDKFWKKEREEQSRIVEEVRLKREEFKKEQLTCSSIEQNVTTQNHNTSNNDANNYRKQRNQEAQELIAQRTIDAKSIFEPNPVVQVKKVPEKPVRTSILKAQSQAANGTTATNTPNLAQEKPPPVVEEHHPPENIVEESDDEGDQYSTIKRSPKDVDKKNAEIDYVEHMTSTRAETVKQITDQQFVDEYLYGLTTPGLQAKALYDYQAADDTEISFDPGDIITNIDQVDEGWWQGLAPDGVTYGLFPANYVELIQ